MAPLFDKTPKFYWIQRAKIHKNTLGVAGHKSATKSFVAAGLLEVDVISTLCQCYSNNMKVSFVNVMLILIYLKKHLH